MKNKFWSCVLLASLCLYGAASAAENGAGPTPRKAKPIKPVTLETIQKLTEAMPAVAPAKPSHPRKLLVFTLCQGHVHDAIPVTSKALEIMGAKSGAFEVVVSDDPRMLAPAKLHLFDALCFNNTTKLELEADQKQAIMDFLRAGKGVIGLHGAADNFQSWPEGAEMIGGVFAGHPWKANGTWAIKVNEANHPLAASFGGQGFKVNDELYTFKAIPSQEKVRVLLSVDLTDEITGSKANKSKAYAVAWIHPYGGGRVFYCGLGHNESVFQTPAILAHLLAGIQYALGDLKVEDTAEAI